VTAGALSHQIRGLEELLGLKLFERRVRSIALTSAGKHIDGSQRAAEIVTAPGLALRRETLGQHAQ
jgi:DNA-binding transcriptional LysR family regulator